MPAISSSISPCIPMRQDRMADMDGHLILVDGSEREVTAENVKRLLESSARFWLDLAGLDQDTASRCCATPSDFTRWPSKTPSISVSAQSSTPTTIWLLVVYGATPAGPAGGSALLLHRELPGHRPPRPLPRPGRPGRPTPTTGRSARRTTSCCSTGCWTSWSTVTSRSWPASTTRSTSWRTRSCSDPPSSSSGRLFDMKRSLIALRKVVTPQRDMFATLAQRRGCPAGHDPRGRALLP